MIVLGIDPGITNMGVGVVQQVGKKAQVLHGELIKTQHGQTGPQRVGILYRSVFAVAQKYKPTAISVEEQFFYRQNELAYKIGWAMGAVFLVADQLEIPIFGYGPPKIKQAIVGTGSADKDQIAYMVTAILGLKSVPKPSHVADALAIALTHCAYAALAPGKPVG